MSSMKPIPLGKSSLRASRLAYGCWRIGEPGVDGPAAVRAALDAGFTLFDHADIYCDGRGESIFGEVLRGSSSLRAHVVIASKCGIRKSGEPRADAPFRYDFSASHIVSSCNHSLRRLGVTTIDLYQLHRPDWLMDPAEVARAFDELKRAGKVREFGVSNFRPSQLDALQAACPMPLIVNQVELSLAQLAPFLDGTLDQCLADKITPLAWSPLAGGLLGDGAKSLLPSQQSYKVQKIVETLDALAKAHNASRTALALAWLLKHPAHIIPIIGSTNPASIREAVKSVNVELSREEWYRPLEAARGERLP